MKLEETKEKCPKCGAFLKTYPQTNIKHKMFFVCGRDGNVFINEDRYAQYKKHANPPEPFAERLRRDENKKVLLLQNKEG